MNPAIIHPDCELVNLPNGSGAFLLVHPDMPTIIVYPSGHMELYEPQFSGKVN